jgi:hypothetical protein
MAAQRWNVGAVLAGSLLVGLAGCSSYTDPTLRVAGAGVADEGPGALVLDVTIAAQNRNHVELPLREIEYTVSIDGREVFRGVRSPEATLRRLGEQTFTVPAVLVYDGPRPVGPHEFEIEGEVRYITPGELAQALFDTGVRRPTVRFSDRGRVELGDGTHPAPAAPAASPVPDEPRAADPASAAPGAP